MDIKDMQEDLDWLKQKIWLEHNAESAKKRFVRRGQVYRVDLGTGVGAEIGKERPCVVLQNDIGNFYSANTVIAPVTSKNSRPLPTIVDVGTLKGSDDAACLFGAVNLTQVRAVSKARLGDYITTVPVHIMREVDAALARELDLMHYFSDALTRNETLKAANDALKQERDASGRKEG